MTAPPIDWHDVCTDTEPGDLRGQAAGPHALWTAETVPTQEKYL